MIALGCVLGCASTAWAAGDLFYSIPRIVGVQDASDNGDGVTQRVLSCPASHPTATGGGAEIAGDQTNLDLELKSSAPLIGGSGPDDWDFQANNSSGSHAQMTISVICAQGTFVHPTELAHVPAGDSRTRTATCPAHTKLAGGGTFTTRDGDHRTEIGDSAPEGTRPHPDSWTGTINNGSDQAVNMGVRAVCARRGSFRVVRTSRKPLPDGSQVSAVANCPHGTRVTGGGVRITGLSDALEVASSAPTDSHKAWHGLANNDGSGRAEHMQTFAVCKG